MFGDPLDDRRYEDDDDYIDGDGIEIHSDTFDKDFDEINFDGEVDDDSDEDARDFFDY